jgi:hypothetical protein
MKGGIMFVDNLADNNVNLDSLAEGVAPLDKKATDVDLDKFFQTLEQQVNGGVYENEPIATPDTTANVNLDPVEPSIPDPEPVSKPDATSAEVAEMRKELDEFKQRYSDSSKEAKRLYEENREISDYRDYIPILKTMRDDPGLINHVRNYLEGNATPPTVKDELNLSEDFIFDGDEAVRDPNSQSAKVLGSMINRGVEQRLKQHTQLEDQQRAERQHQETQDKMMNEFRTKMDMSAEDFTEFVDFAKGRQLTLEDIYYLKNRENREKLIAKKAIEEREKQLKKMNGVPASMASDGGYTEPVDDDKMVFDAIAKAAGTQNIFGD